MHDSADNNGVIEDEVAVQNVSVQNAGKCESTVMEPLMNSVGGSVRQTVQFHRLYLFSRPERSRSGFQKFCSELGQERTCLDIEYSPEHDLLCQDVWEAVQADMGRYDAYSLT